MHCTARFACLPALELARTGCSPSKMRNGADWVGVDYKLYERRSQCDAVDLDVAISLFLLTSGTCSHPEELFSTCHGESDATDKQGRLEQGDCHR